MARRRSAVAGVLALLAAAVTGLAGPAAAFSSPSLARTASTVATDSADPGGEPTIDVNALRDGWDADEPGLTPASVQSGNFGQLFATKVQGQVYGQPILVHHTATDPGVLVVVTEDDYVYGLDPVDGQILWRTGLGQPWSAGDVLGCSDLVPNIGVTSTPVYDPATDAIYVMAKSAPDGLDSTDPIWQLHSLDPATGTERAGWPTTISGSPDNDPANPFDPEDEAQRPGLLLLDGVVYAGFASYCDLNNYNGYVVGVSTTTAKRTAMFSTAAGTNDGEDGIWQAGGGLVSDGPGQILLTTGNGNTGPLTATATPPSVLNEAVVRLTVQSDGTLRATDWFSPVDRDNLDANDLDLGSSGPTAIPDGYGTAAHPHLLVQEGKAGRAYLLDRDHLGGLGQGPNGGDAVLDSVDLDGGVWGHAAFWGGSPGTSTAGGYVYVPTLGPLTALKLSTDSNGSPTLLSAAETTMSMGYTSGSPVVTSDGTAAGTALVWDESFDWSSGLNPVLRAFDATPDGGTLDQVFSAPLDPPGVTDGGQAHGSKFATVATYDGRVYTGTRDGYVFGFGQPSAAPLTSPPVDFGDVPVGATSSPASMTLTATRPVTVHRLDVTGPYSVVSTTPSLPATLGAADALSVQLTLSPTSPGDQTGSLSAETDDPAVPTVAFGLSGFGTQAGLVANPQTLDFGQVAVGSALRRGVTLLNASTGDESVASVSALPAPFTSTALPQPGQIIPAQSSFAVPLTYRPTDPSASSDDLTVTLEGGGSVTVHLQGSGIDAAPQIALQPPSVDFGLVPLGHAVTKTFSIANTGNITLTVSKAKAPYNAFRTDQPLGEGKQISPGQSVVQPITFRPLATGTATGHYLITVTDGHGPHYEQFVGTDDQLTDRYDGSRSLRRLLGPATGPTVAVRGGYERTFEHGVMYWSATAGIHEVNGRVLRRYAALGAQRSWLGYPTTDTQRTGARSQQRFQHGVIRCPAAGRCRASRS